MRYLKLWENFMGDEITDVKFSKEDDRPFTFTMDIAFKKGNVMVQRVGGSMKWKVAINGKPEGMVLDAPTKEIAFGKAIE